MKFENILILTLISALFGIALISFAVQIQIENNSPTGILQDSLINSTYSSLKSTINNVSAVADTQQQSFESENPVISFGSLVFQTITSVLRVLRSAVIIIPNLFINLISVYIFGGNETMAIITLTITTILTILTILAIWRVIRLGY